MVGGEELQSRARALKEERPSWRQAWSSTASLLRTCFGKCRGSGPVSEGQARGGSWLCPPPPHAREAQGATCGVLAWLCCPRVILLSGMSWVDTSQGCWEAQERRTMGSSSGSRRKGVFTGAKRSSWPGRVLVWCLGACWGWQPMLRGPAYTCLSEDRGQLTHGSLAFYLEGRAGPTGDIYTKAPPLLLSGTEGLESQLSFCLPSVLPCMLRPLPGHLQRSPAGRVEGEPQGECPGQCMACCKGTLL